MVWKSDTRRNYARNRSDYASSTTDKEWERILPQLPKAKVRGRPRKHDLRRIVDGIFYLLQSGCQWDMLPKDFPPWQTVYRYFRDWRKDGTWARLHDALYRDIRVKVVRKAQALPLSTASQSKRDRMQGKWLALMQAKRSRDVNVISWSIHSA